jgi:CHASE3 domain sensor protein
LSFYIETEFYKTREYTPGVFSFIVFGAIFLILSSLAVYTTITIARSEYMAVLEAEQSRANIERYEQAISSLDAKLLEIHTEIEEMLDEELDS